MQKLFAKLKKRWNITSNLQLVVILLVFSLTGMSALYIRRIIFELIGIGDQTAFWLKAILYVLILFPVYQILFLAIGTLFGQFRFVWEFEKKMLSRFRLKKPVQEKKSAG